ncbi:heavy-metal-associated domain-containing protein [Lactococcus lactis]|uniref:Heavy-metal-associated domain-containing protein n=1 Tax=Lactococcus lactis TaxID=1358 RepID=A0AAP3Z2A4_9LACT|nr:heavy-metal-associated domain-containing protein [Lactococcus lactis]MDG4977019.1 heavy-metal-associated domain-containing protein [Lactococcus lactis]
MSKIVMKLDELSCPSCMAKIEGVLNTTNGVETAKVLFNASKVKAEFNDNQVTATDLVSKVEGLGYVVQKSKVTEI